MESYVLNGQADNGLSVWMNGQPIVRGDDRADGRLAEQRQSDIDHLQVELKGRDSQLQ